MLPAEPRHFLPSPGLPGAGLPHDRLARLAARRAFVELKLNFQQAVAELEGHDGQWLRRQVRSAEEPNDLWLLRAPVFEALAGSSAAQRQRRRTLRRCLDSHFPDSEPAVTGWGPF
ncbi:MAG: hypothetical protein WAQ05_23910 [Rubrivivax sp.]